MASQDNDKVGNPAMVPAQRSCGTTTTAGPTASVANPVAVAVSVHCQYSRRCDEPHNGRTSPTSGKHELTPAMAWGILPSG